MADNNKMNEATSSVETTDRGMFDFMKKKEDSKEEYKAPQEGHVISSGVEKVHVSEEPKCDEEKKHGGLLEKLHRSDSSSSSSSDEEGDDEEKKKKRKEKKDKKKGLKEKIEEEIGGHHKEGHHHEDTAVPIEEVHVYTEPSYPVPAAPDHHHQEAEEKKGGFLDKIKEKLPGTTKPEEHTAAVAAPVQAGTEPCAEGDKEKKGFLDKIKEKIPGFHSKSDAHEEKKDHD